MTKTRRTASEIIATYLSWDIRDVSDCRYQSTRYTAPAVYSIPLKGGIEYVCAPSGAQKPPRGFPEWTLIGEIYGRTIYGATSKERD